MTYWSRICRISCGVGSLLLSLRAGSEVAPSSRMMSLHRSMHSSQMNTDGPAISFLTSCWLLPQKEQYSSFSLELFLSDMPPAPRIRCAAPRSGGIAALDEDLVNQPVAYCIVSRHEVIAI